MNTNNQEIAAMTARANHLLVADKVDRDEYRRFVDFVIQHSATQRNNPDFAKLEDLLDEIAFRHNLPSVQSIRENFGLNSCAQ